MTTSNITIEDIKGGISAECGCYEETCLIYPFETILHLEPDGTGDAFFDCGDYQLEENFPAKTIEELRQQALDYVSGLWARGFDEETQGGETHEKQTD